jgi:hypothetical protein
MISIEYSFNYKYHIINHQLIYSTISIASSVANALFIISCDHTVRSCKNRVQMVVSMSIGYLSHHCSKHIHADLGKPPRAPSAVMKLSMACWTIPSIQSVDFPAAHVSGHRRVSPEIYIII